jgi:hypothetical protein
LRAVLPSEVVHVLSESRQSAESRALRSVAAHPPSPVDELLLLMLAPIVLFLMATAVATIVVAFFRPGGTFVPDNAVWQAASAGANPTTAAPPDEPRHES